MRLAVSCAFVLAALVFPAAQETPVKYFAASEMTALFAKGGTVTAGADYKVMAAQRTGVGEAELHERETGGRIVGARATDPGETRGTGIEGGETRQLSAGDVIVIERGTPHWFKAVDGRVEYFVVKVISR